MPKITKENTTVRLIVSGLGNIGWRFLQILIDKQQHLRRRYGLTFQVVGTADSRGAVADPDGLDLVRIVGLKKGGRSVSDYHTEMAGPTPPGLAFGSALDLVNEIDADALCEATPVSLDDGEPGLSCMRAALRKRMHVVTPNKGPLVLAYEELTELARIKGVEILFCGTVAGGLPAINVGRRDLAGATIDRLEALPNLTTSFILAQMATGLSYEEALAAAQAQGCAEADSSLDVEGWDAAIKLVILAKSVLGVPASLDDVSVQGITGLTIADLQEAETKGRVIKLVATAQRQEEGYALTVAPTPLPLSHPLALLSGQQMGVVYHTDIYGVISAAILETEPVPSAATMLRDLLTLYA
jgi:homoserine dehydrogenase